jgi:cell division protein DivIC
MSQQKRRSSHQTRAQQVRKRRQRKQNRTGMICITGIVATMLIAVSVQILDLHQRNEEYIRQEEQLNIQLESEKARQQDIADYEGYVDTPEYIEQLARTKLGLVYKGEIIFKEEKSE